MIAIMALIVLGTLAVVLALLLGYWIFLWLLRCASGAPRSLWGLRPFLMPYLPSCRERLYEKSRRRFSVHFVLRIAAKSSLGLLLVPFSDSLSETV